MQPPAIIDWYATPAGRRAAAILARPLATQLGGSGTQRLLGLGVTAPLLARFPAPRERTALLTDAANARAWPEGANVMAVGDFARLPFADALFDDVLMVHALEFAERPALWLREVWRVLAPAGWLTLVVPNRSGLWAQFERTPFGHGHPWGAGPLAALLGDAMFETATNTSALFAPPVPGLRWLAPLLRLGPQFGGVRIVTARKTDGVAPPLRSRAAIWAPAPAVVRQSSQRGSHGQQDA